MGQRKLAGGSRRQVDSMEMTMHMRAMILTLLSGVYCGMLHAEVVEESFSGRLASDRVEETLGDLVWIRQALAERCMAVGVDPPDADCVNALVFKDICKDLIPRYVDHTKSDGDKFDDYCSVPTTNVMVYPCGEPVVWPIYGRDIPCWSVGEMMTTLGLPTNYLEYTPPRLLGLNGPDITNEFIYDPFTTENYSATNMMKIIKALKWTSYTYWRNPYAPFKPFIDGWVTLNAGGGGSSQGGSSLSMYSSFYGSSNESCTCGVYDCSFPFVDMPVLTNMLFGWKGQSFLSCENCEKHGRGRYERPTVTNEYTSELYTQKNAAWFQQTNLLSANKYYTDIYTGIPFTVDEYINWLHQQPECIEIVLSSYDGPGIVSIVHPSMECDQVYLVDTWSNPVIITTNRYVHVYGQNTKRYLHRVLTTTLNGETFLESNIYTPPYNPALDVPLRESQNYHVSYYESFSNDYKEATGHYTYELRWGSLMTVKSGIGNTVIKWDFHFQ